MEDLQEWILDGVPLETICERLAARGIQISRPALSKRVEIQKLIQQRRELYRKQLLEELDPTIAQVFRSIAKRVKALDVECDALNSKVWHPDTDKNYKLYADRQKAIDASYAAFGKPLQGIAEVLEGKLDPSQGKSGQVQKSAQAYLDHLIELAKEKREALDVPEDEPDPTLN